MLSQLSTAQGGPEEAGPSHLAVRVAETDNNAVGSTVADPIGIFIQPACLQHKYIRHANSSHIFERPERLRAVLLGVAAAAARLEEAEQGARDALKALRVSAGAGVGGGFSAKSSSGTGMSVGDGGASSAGVVSAGAETTGATGTGAEDDLSNLLSSLNIAKQPTSHTANPSSSSSIPLPQHLHLVPPLPSRPTGQILLHHPALQLAHSAPSEEAIPYLPRNPDGSARRFGAALPSSEYMKELLKWATEAPEKIKMTGCEIPPDRGLNQGDLYLGPGSVVAIEGAIQTVCQAVDHVVSAASKPAARRDTAIKQGPDIGSSAHSGSPAPSSGSTGDDSDSGSTPAAGFTKAFCAIRPPGHHCGQDEPSGFCYVNNVVVAAMHAYLEHDIDRAIIIDFDLHHGNGTQALIMPLNAATYADELALKAGKPHSGMKGKNGKLRRGWKGFYGSVHDIYSYPCEDGDLDLVKDASLSLAAHGQYIENVHLQPYSSTSDFYTRIYPLYSTLLRRAEHFLSTSSTASPGSDAHDPDRTILFISAGFDACEHEYPAMQRHDRRVPASFFERYTADIAAFADKWCGGKVVSVLEGGYSDRALTSGAMGHVVGMASARQAGERLRGQTSQKIKDEEAVPSGMEAAAGGNNVVQLTETLIGEESWYAENELAMLERATKKKRTGKLHPFPSDLSHLPHLARTHALLGHFESIGTAPSTADGALPSGAANGHGSSMTPSHSAPSGIGISSASAQSTPIATGRMTLRTRKAAVEMDRDVEALVTPPRAVAGAGASGRGRGRGRGGVGAIRAEGGRATTMNTPTSKQAVQAAGSAQVEEAAMTPAIKVSEVLEGAAGTPVGRDAMGTPTTRSARVLRSSPSPSKPQSGSGAAFDPDLKVELELSQSDQGSGRRCPSTPSAGSVSELDDELSGAMGGMAIRGSPSPVKAKHQPHGQARMSVESPPSAGQISDSGHQPANYSASIYPQHFATSSIKSSTSRLHPPGSTSHSGPAHAPHVEAPQPAMYDGLAKSENPPTHTGPGQNPITDAAQSSAPPGTERAKIFLKFTRPTLAASTTATTATGDGSGNLPKHFVSTSDTKPSAPS